MKTIKLLIICLLLFPTTNNAQRKKKVKEPEIKIVDSLFHGLKWRNIGPFRGGRSVNINWSYRATSHLLHGIYRWWSLENY